ncbi:MAG: PHP domain-containing protein [Candidatus Aenigmatarchaeota archaeon]
MRIDCHCHTVYSKHWLWGLDALNTPEEVIKAAIRRGLDGLAIVDHNNVKGSLAAKKIAKRYNFTVLTGAEIKTDSGDLIALGIKENVPMLLTVEETIERIHDRGGIAVAAHPFGKFVFRRCIGNQASKADAVEVFNSTLTKIANHRALSISKRYHIGRTAGSDAHSMNEVGNAGIICYGDPIENIIKNKVDIFGVKTPLRNTALNISRKLIRSAERRISKRRRMCQKYFSSSLMP